MTLENGDKVLFQRLVSAVDHIEETVELMSRDHAVLTQKIQGIPHLQDLVEALARQQSAFEQRARAIEEMGKDIQKILLHSDGIVPKIAVLEAQSKGAKVQRDTDGLALVESKRADANKKRWEAIGFMSPGIIALLIQVSQWIRK